MVAGFGRRFRITEIVDELCPVRPVACIWGSGTAVGHPKDRRPDLKQIQTRLAVSGDDGIPVFHRAYMVGRRRWRRSPGR